MEVSLNTTCNFVDEAWDEGALRNVEICVESNMKVEKP